MKTNKFVPFSQTLALHNISFTRRPIEIFQINLGKLCNQACHHCHVEAGPTRMEMMDRRTVDRLLKLIANANTVHTVDLTGGAPELNPNFRHLVTSLVKLGKKVIDRCNLTVLFEKGQEDTAEFLREHRVQIVASLPCYLKENVEKQRGNGVFEKSIRALKLLNVLGYGKDKSGLELHLVYNPLGAFLPPAQTALETEYKHQLHAPFGIEFNRLFTITNMPIQRFLHELKRTGEFQAYRDLLFDHFNPQAARGVMCHSLVSVGWDGQIFDCDFNQMLEIPLSWKQKTIWDIENLKEIESGPIALADHCYGCAAGAGSSCGGAVLN